MHDMNDAAITDWLNEMRSQDAIDERTAREMEDHFRCAITDRIDSGDSPEAALSWAKAEFGKLEDVNAELSKVHIEVPMIRKLLWILVGYSAIQLFLSVIGNSTDMLSLIFIKLGMRGIIELPWQLSFPFYSHGISETNRIATSMLLSHIVYYGAFFTMVFLCIAWMRASRSPLIRITRWISSSRRRFLIVVVLLAGISYTGFSPYSVIESVRSYLDIVFPWHWQETFMQFFQLTEAEMGMPAQEYELGRMFSFSFSIAWICIPFLTYLCFTAAQAISIDSASPIAWGITGYFLIPLIVKASIWFTTLANIIVPDLGFRDYWERPIEQIGLGLSCLCFVGLGVIMGKLFLSKNLATWSVFKCRMPLLFTTSWLFFHTGITWIIIQQFATFASDYGEGLGFHYYLLGNEPKIASVALVITAFVISFRFKKYASDDCLTA
ncbi:MAG: hypothetical protein ACI9R3_005520 [Verrucomicrobiales bacterium]|jgi:hypothetical protein